MQALIATDRPDNKAKTARVKTAATTNITVVKAAPGNVYGFVLTSKAAAATFVKFYDKATAPVLATDVPKFTLGVPANGVVSESFPTGLQFLLGISYAITGGATGAVDTDTGVTAVDDVNGFIAFY